MKRSHLLAALALISFLPPSVAAAPPVRASIARVEPPLDSTLSASRASDRALIAQRYAPIHYQFVDRRGANGLDGRADYITRVDFDGDWNAKNDWENAARHKLPGAAYHSVVETKTHWFVVYMFYHPRDWANSLFDTEHENDSEGVLLAIQRDETRFGRLRAAVTVAHSDFYSFVPANSPWSAAGESLDGVLELENGGSGRPLVTQESGGHALRAWRAAARFEGIVYRPSLVAGPAPKAGDRAASYVLLDLFEAGGLWQRRDDPSLFAGGGAFFGDDGGSCGSGGVLCTENAANAPWGWDDGDDGDVGRGDIATDPVRLVTRYFRIPEPVSRHYTYNRYLDDPARPETPEAPEPGALVARASGASGR
jgi:hypothetical protein